MNILQLRYFDEICRCCSLSKASKKLFISQQGLSMAIMRLEEEFSCKLLKRGPKGVALTDEGKFLWERAKIILEQTRICEEHFERLRLSCKTIHVGSAFGVVSEFAGKLVMEFQAEHPNVKISTTEYPSLDLDLAVENEDVEFGIGIAPFDLKKFDVIHLFSIPLCLIVSTKHPLAEEKLIRTEDLDKLNMAVVDERFKSSMFFLDNCRSLGVNPNVVFRAGEAIGVPRLISSTPTVAGLSTVTVAHALKMPNTVSIPFENKDFTWDIYIVKKRGAALLPDTQALANYIHSRTTSDDSPVVLPAGREVYTEEQGIIN